MLSPFQNGGPQARPSSPVSGRSTLTTSAPSAARIWAQYGPAIDVVTSRTRIPRSGACMTASSPDAPLRGCTAVFDQFTEWVSGAWWSYPLIFAVVDDRRVLPARPERDASSSPPATSPRAAISGSSVVIAAAAGGAIVGDNISYGIGKYAGEHTVKRLFRSEKARRGFEWAEQQLDERGFYIIVIARFIPGGRTAVTFSSGYMHAMPWRHFIVDDVVRRPHLGDVRGPARVRRRQDLRGPAVEGPVPRLPHRDRRRRRHRGDPLVHRQTALDA